MGSPDRKTTAAVTRELGGEMSFETFVLDELREDETLIRISAVGICHTDISFHTGHFLTDLPIVLGHEGSGIIEQVGSRVGDFEIGERVVLTFGSCRACSPCRTGHPAYCTRIPELNLVGNRRDGSSAFGGEVRSHFFGQSSFATRAIVPAANLIKVADDAPLELLGPLGCGIQTGAGAVFRSLKVSAGRSLAIWGAGAVGLSALMAAVIVGAYPIFVIDRNVERLKLAIELGATFAFDSSNVDPVSRIRGECPSGVDFSIEAIGSPVTLRQAVAALAPLGSCGLVGGVGPGTDASFDWQHVQMNGITLRGIVEGDSISSELIPMLIDLQRRGRFPFEKLVRFYDFADIDQAFADAVSGRTIKPILRMPRDRAS